MHEQFRAVLQDAGDDKGTFRAVATAAGSLILGERGPTRFARGAFRDSLARSSRYPLLWQHRDGDVIGISEFNESPEGLMVNGTLALGTRRGAEAHELMKMGAVTDVSIGFTTERHRMVREGERQVRLVEAAKLAECSIVTWGADKGAKVLSVHAASHGDDVDAMVEALAGVLAEIEHHEGKVFSAGNLAKLNAAVDSLFDLVSIVDPGRVAALGRKAARLMKKSLVLVSRKQRAKHRSAVRAAWLRQAEMLADIGDVPLLTMTPPWMSPGETREPEDALQGAIVSACGFPGEAKRMLVTEAVKQYLVLVEDAEEVDPEDDDFGAKPIDGQIAAVAAKE